MAKKKDEKSWWVELLEAHRDEFRAALGVQRPFDQWYTVSIKWIERNVGLKWNKVTKSDTVNAFIAAASNGLLVDGEECMVMIRGQKDPKIRCEIGAKGVVRQAGNAGIVVNSRTIREGDKIEIDEGAGIVHHTPAWLFGGKPGGETLGYYAVATYRDGRQVVRSMSYDEAQSRASDKGPWQTHPDPMGEKSAILNIRKVLYLGDEIEGMLKASGAEIGDTWALREAEQEAEQEPAYPPQSTRDKVLTQASRDEQDASSEASQEEVEQPGGGYNRTADERESTAEDAGGPI